MLVHLSLCVVRSNCPRTLTALPPAHYRPPAAAAPCLSVLQTMRERGWMRYSTVEEADITAERVAVVPEEVDRQRVRFQQVRRRTCLRCVRGCHVMSCQTLGRVKRCGVPTVAIGWLLAHGAGCDDACLACCRATHATCRPSWGL